MTTQADWAFRAQHLMDYANHLETQATEMMKRAAELRAQASQVNDWRISEATAKAIEEIDANRRNALINADRIVAG
jgi:hypothetical protein